MQCEHQSNTEGKHQENDEFLEGTLTGNFQNQPQRAAAGCLPLLLLLLRHGVEVFIHKAGENECDGAAAGAEVDDPEQTLYGVGLQQGADDYQTCQNGTDVHEQVVEIEPRGPRSQGREASDGGADTRAHERRTEGHDTDAEHHDEAGILVRHVEQRRTQIRAEAQEQSARDEDGEADEVGAFQSDDVADGTDCKHKQGEEEGVHAHPEGSVRIFEAAVFNQEQHKDIDHGEIRQAVEELDEVGQPKVLPAVLQYAELREVAYQKILFLVVHERVCRRGL